MKFNKVFWLKKLDRMNAEGKGDMGIDVFLPCLHFFDEKVQHERNIRSGRFVGNLLRLQRYLFHGQHWRMI